MDIPQKVTGLFVALIVAPLLPLTASGFQLRKTAFSGGGVAAAGGSYSLHATVGEAGPVSRVVAGRGFVRRRLIHVPGRTTPLRPLRFGWTSVEREARLT